MDISILIVLVLAIVSAVSSANKKRARRQSGDDEMSSPARTGRQGPASPVDAELPRQPAMPIHWEGAEGTPSVRSIPEPDPALAAYYMEGSLMTPSWREEEVQRDAQSEPPANPVRIEGLDIALDGNTLVKGVIFSEILTRRPARRTRWTN